MDSNHDPRTEQYLAEPADGRLDNDQLVLAPVRPTTDVGQLARNLARQGHSGARIVMYPLTPFH